MRPQPFVLPLLFLLGAAPLHAAPPRLVRDIDTRELVNLGSQPDRFVSLESGPDSGVSLFVAEDGLAGREVWRSDGTESGTWRLTDACPGSCGSDPFFLRVEGARTFFITTEPGEGTSLWGSDGTEPGTVRLAGPLSLVGQETAWVESRKLLFFVATDLEHGTELWVSDGAADGAWRVADIDPGASSSGPHDLTPFQDGVAFVATEGVHGTSLWRSDGTPAGTKLVRATRRSDGQPSGPEGLQAVGSRLFFLAPSPRFGFELWTSDGTREGTVPVIDLVPGPRGPDFFEVSRIGDKLFFVVDAGRGQELWTSDGTARGTLALTHFAPGDALARSSFPLSSAALGRRAVFAADDGVHGLEPWITDGTPAGTRLLRDLCPGPCSGFGEAAGAFFVQAGRLYFAAQDGVHGFELWSSDGRGSGTRMVRDLWPGPESAGPGAFGRFGEQIVFGARDPKSRQTQLWRTGGTSSGTVRITSLPLGVNPGQRGSVPGTLLFQGWDEEHREELWRSDGTRAGTGLLKDIHRADMGGSFPRYFQRDGDAVRFVASTLKEEIWRSDGTAAGTTRLDVLPFCTGGMELQGILPDGAGVLTCEEAALDNSLWRVTTGSPAVRLSPPGLWIGSPWEIEILGSRIFFPARNRQHREVGEELWVSDGTAEGTVQIADLRPGLRGSDPRDLTAFQGRVYFSAWSAGTSRRELWASDGSAAGTVQITGAGEGLFPTLLGEHAGRLWFAGTDPEHGRELWSTDGTAAGTERMADLAPATLSFDPVRLIPAGDRMFLGAGPNGASTGLWVSDGTEAGTHRIGPWPPGPALPLLGPDAAVVDGRLFYIASAGGRSEMWQSDGTEAGTGPVPGPDGWPIGGQDLTPCAGRLWLIWQEGLWSTDGLPGGTVRIEGVERPGALIAAGPYLLFSAFDPAHGMELWALEP